MVDVMVKPPIEPTYLGDGVKASFDGYQIELKTLDSRRQTIYIEPGVWYQLERFARRCWSPVESGPARDRPDE